jgi:hypothetical protein
MGVIREAADRRIFAPEWQIVALRRPSELDSAQSDSIQSEVARACGTSAKLKGFSLLGCEAHHSDTVVYASRNRRGAERKSRFARRIASYTTFEQR